jgi:hypothetical protein
MATDVTVLGSGGTTVTIPVTASDVAKAAQTALAGISNLVTGGVLTQVNYTGGSTLPGISTSEGGVIATGAATVPLAPFGLGAPYASAVLGGAAVQQVLVNFGTNGAIIASGAGGSTVSSGTTVTGAGGAEIGNLGTNTQVFFGGATNQDFSELGLGAFGGTGTSSIPSATVWVTTALRGASTFDDSNGQTTINLDTVASSGGVVHPFGQVIILDNSGNGQTTVNVASAPTVAGTLVDGMEFSFRATSAVATTINAAGSSVTGTGGNTEWDLMKSGNAYINGDGSDIILFPTGAGVAATLFGGSGTDIDAGVSGLIKGGSGGSNILFGGTTPGSTTLIGGGSNDVLVQQSNGNTFGTGAGAENLYGLVAGDTYMEAVTNTVAGSGANSATINGFVSGTDSISLANPAGGQYSLIGNTTTAPTPSQVAFTDVGANTVVTFGDGTTWQVINAHLQNTDFHT